MSKENDRQKADELLQKLHAAFLNDEKAEPVEEKEELPAAKEQPQPTPKTEKKEKSAAPKKAEPRPAEEPKPSAPAAILALTEDAPDVTGEKPVDNVKTENATPATEEKTGSAQRKARPNAVKIPPRRRSGVNTGAIGQRTPAAKTTPGAPKKAVPATSVQSDSRAGDVTVPRAKSDRAVSAAPTNQDPLQKVAEPNISELLPPDASSLNPDPSVVVDFDSHASSVVEPIENTEAAETVSEPTAEKVRRRWRKAKIENGQDATSVIAKRTGLDESDIALIFELGYENELGRLVGYETLKKLKYEHLRNSGLASEDYYGQAFGYLGREYTAAVPDENVVAAYTHDRKRLILKIALMALISALLFFADFPVFLKSYLPSSLANIPWLFPSLALALLTGGIVLTGKRLFAGWRTFLRFETTPYSIVAVSIPFIWLYGAGAIVTSIFQTENALPPMNFAASMALLLLLVCDAIRIADEIRTFRMVSSPELKTVLEEVEPRKTKLRQGDRTVKIINDEAGQSLYRVRRAHEVVGFFRRVNDLSAAGSVFSRMIFFSLICAVLGGLATSLIFQNPLRGVLVFAATLMFSAPASAIFLFFDPLRRANRHLLSRRSVLVGEGSVNEYSGSKTIIFSDTDAFRAKRQTQVNLPDGDEFRRDIRLAEALFRKIGGTLATVDQPIMMEEDPNTTINLVRLTETGVEALIDNKYRILAGDSTFLLHSDVEIPRESTDRAVGRSRGVSVLYVAINGALKLTYEIAYTMNQSFREIIALLARTDTTLAVQSYDPNLNNAFLHVGFADGDEVVRIIKPAQFETPTTAEITDTGAVALDGPLATAYPLRAASLIVRARQAGFRALMTSIFPGALLAFFLAWLLPKSVLPFLPLMAVGYRFAWLVVSWLISLLSLRRRAVFEDTRESLAINRQN